MTQTNVRLKLLIDSKAQRVLYGEADKNFIDFLFNLLSLPLGAVIRLLKKEGMVGCLENLYESIETLNETYLQPNQNKDTILKPKVSFNCSAKLLPNIETFSATSTAPTPTPTPTPAPAPAPATRLLFSCSTTCRYNNPPPLFSCSNICRYNNRHPIISNGTDEICRQCENFMRPFGAYVQFSSPSIQPITSGEPIITSGEKVGFVKGLATYIVMDDLTVKHISDFSITTLFKKFNIKKVDSLEEKVITLDVDEGVELLKTSLQSKTVLTNVFLKRRQHIKNDIELYDELN